MTFGREKRLLLGAVALIVALPLPLTDALEWPALALFLLVVGLFMRRAWEGSEHWLGHRALNLLGLAYLPILVLDFALSGRVQFVRPILHLILFGLAAKLWSLEREKDKWQAWIGIFFLFLAAMSTSTHPSVVAYLLAFSTLAVVLLVRFVHLHVLSSFGGAAGEKPRLPLVGFVTAVIVATALLAVPLFALLPRVRTPMMTGPAGIGSQPTLPQAGFSDEMSLDLIGRIRDNPTIAARLTFEGRAPDPRSMRLKAAGYDIWEGRSWRRIRGGQNLRRERGVASIRLARGRPVGRAHVVLEPLRSRSLVLPLETIEVTLADRRMDLDSSGAVSLGSIPTTPVEYDATLGEGARSLAAPPTAGSARGPLDLSGVSERMSALAASWAGSGSDRQRASRIESHLRDDYGYTLAFVGRGGESPIESFLFDDKQGHCEYFASAMVLLLRAQGIPARVVTGFYGAEWSSWESVWVIRQSNAHAWVEAWIEGAGWQVFDPTPPEGLPLERSRDLRLWARQAWEAMVFRWDRWVISYDFEDQVGVLGRLRSAWDRWMARLLGRAEPEAAAGRGSPATAVDGLDLGAEALPRWWQQPVVWAAAVAVIASLLGGLWLRRRPRPTVTAAYLKLRRILQGGGVAVPESLAPLALARRAALDLPEAAASSSRVIDLYLRETFAGRSTDDSEVAALQVDLARVESAARRRLRRGGRQRPRAA